MGFSGPMSGVFYSGSPVTALVPSVYPVAVEGHPYFIDTQPELYTYRWRHESIPILRAQADQARTPAETSLNPDVLWRRAQDSWHRGVGQKWLDRDPNLSDPYRFNSSKGIDVWTQYQMSLLPDTEAENKSGANTNYYMVVAGTRLYVADGANVYFTSALAAGSTSWTACTGYTGAAVLSICTDGFTVYFTDGANVWTTNTGTSAASSVNTQDISVIAYVKGRLLGSNAGTLYQFTAAATAVSLFSPQIVGTNFTWVGFAEGQTVIYAAGYVGDKSTIWKTSILADGTNLAIPTVAGTLPAGEIVRSIHGYLGALYIGTDKGWRYATEDTSGNLTIGVLVSTPGAVLAFHGQNKYVWFGWTNYDGTSTGIGRIDITQSTGITGSGQLAYASDLMVTGQGAINSITTFTNLRVVGISGLGVYGQAANYVTSGTINSGQINFGIPDAKSLVYADIRTSPLTDGSWSLAVSTDEATFSNYGATQSTVGSLGAQIPLQNRGERFEIQLTLNRGSTPTVTPVITRWTLKSFPAPQDGTVQYLYLPLVLAKDLSGFGVQTPMDILSERTFINNLRATRQVISLQELTRTYSGTVEDLRWLPYASKIDGDYQYREPDGTLLVIFKELA